MSAGKKSQVAPEPEPEPVLAPEAVFAVGAAVEVRSGSWSTEWERACILSYNSGGGTYNVECSGGNERRGVNRKNIRAIPETAKRSTSANETNAAVIEGNEPVFAVGMRVQVSKTRWGAKKYGRISMIWQSEPPTYDIDCHDGSNMQKVQKQFICVSGLPSGSETYAALIEGNQTLNSIESCSTSTEFELNIKRLAPKGVKGTTLVATPENFATLSRNQAAISQQVAKSMSAVYDAVQALGISGISESATADAAKVKEKADAAHNIVEGLAGAAEIAAMSRPISDQMKNIMDKLSQMENSQRQQMQNQRQQMQEQRQQMREQAVAIEGLSRRLTEIANNPKPCCAVM